MTNETLKELKRVLSKIANMPADQDATPLIVEALHLTLKSLTEIHDALKTEECKQ